MVKGVESKKVHGQDDGIAVDIVKSMKGEDHKLLNPL